MTLAEDKRPDATQLIDLSEYALQGHTDYKYAVDVS